MKKVYVNGKVLKTELLEINLTIRQHYLAFATSFFGSFS